MKKIYFFLKFLKINLYNEFQYRINFFVALFYSALDILFSLLTLELVFNNIITINNWTKHEIFLLIGVYKLINGFLNIIIIPSLTNFSQSIRTGDFDYILLMPIDSQFISSIKIVKMWESIDILSGIIIILFCIFKFNIEINPINIFIFLLLLIDGFSIISSIYMILATCSFWIISISELIVIIPQCFEWAGKWPVKIFPKILRFLLTFIIPVGIAFTIPSEALLDKLEIKMIFISTIIAIIFFFISRYLWKKGTRHYSGASS